MKFKYTSMRKTPWDDNTFLSSTEEFIKSNYLDDYYSKHQKLKLTNETQFINSFVFTTCKFCGSKVQSNGFTKNRIKRYYCPNCNKTFTPLTNTIFENHKISISEWIRFSLGIMNYSSLHLSSRNNKKASNTEKYWLEKLFLLLKNYQDDIVLNGTIEIDESYYSIISSEVKEDETGKRKRGLSKDKYSIATGCDMDNNVFCIVMGLGKPSSKKVIKAYGPHIESGSFIIHDKEKSHNMLIKKLNLSHIAYDSKELIKIKHNNPLREINHYHFLLKEFLKSHSGFKRENLQDYLNLFCFIMNKPIDHLEKLEYIINCAIGSAKTLKYRDFFK